MPIYEFPNHDEFINRERELEALGNWYADPHADPVFVLLGRRRVGKSWLIREFAHGKHADIFVADETVPRSQLERFGAQLRESIGVPVATRTARDFFDALLTLGAASPRLAIVDEFPNLLGRGGKADSELAAVLEERQGKTQTKVILAGSQMISMEKLLRARAPLHGRARRLVLPPLRFQQARQFLEPAHSGADLIDRFAIAGGLPRYLHQLGRKGSLRSVVCAEILDPVNAPLYDEPRTVLAMELSEPAVYFTILSALAHHKELTFGDLAKESGLDRSVVSRYVAILRELYLVERCDPMFVTPDQRRSRYRVMDSLMKFWFRFVFPHGGTLNAAGDVGAFYDAVVAPELAAFTSWTFEEICRDWVRRNYQQAMQVGAWWGNSVNALRKGGRRTTEEIDIVGGFNRVAQVVGEVKWTTGQMSTATLNDLETFKIPALEEAGVDVSRAEKVLFSRSGFHPALHAAEARGRVRLVDLNGVLAAT